MKTDYHPVYVFECGCHRPKPKRGKTGMRCPEHKTRLQHVELICECGETIVRSPFHWRTKYCDKCRDASATRQQKEYWQRKKKRRREERAEFKFQRANASLQDREYTLQEIADIEGITRERVRQIEFVAMRKVRKAFETYFPHMIELLLEEGLNGRDVDAELVYIAFGYDQ